MRNRELLQAKAEQICSCCNQAGFPEPICRFVSEYCVNIVWQHNRRKHTLSLYWKPSRQRWTAIPNTTWLENEILPKISPILNPLTLW